MNKPNNSQWIIVGLGEVLWDVYPTGRCFGGAPANFACHAAAIGANAFLISAVGKDDLGKQALAELERCSVDATQVSSNDFPTGNVQIRLVDGEPEYEFASNVAWDFCDWTRKLESYAQTVDAVCFGTLFQRSPTSRRTTRRFLSATREDCLRVFDVNLRQNFYSDEIIVESLKLANVLKLNQAELPVVAKAVGIADNGDAAIDRLLQKFDLQMIALTLGSQGSMLTAATEQHFCPARPIDLMNAVGAGDAFTACVVMGMLHQTPIAKTHEFASHVAATVCENTGAAPEYHFAALNIPWGGIQ